MRYPTESRRAINPRGQLVAPRTPRRGRIWLYHDALQQPRVTQRLNGNGSRSLLRTCSSLQISGPDLTFPELHSFSSSKLRHRPRRRIIERHGRRQPGPKTFRAGCEVRLTSASRTRAPLQRLILQAPTMLRAMRALLQCPPVPVPPAPSAAPSSLASDASRARNAFVSPFDADARFKPPRSNTRQCRQCPPRADAAARRGRGAASTLPSTTPHP